MRDPWPKQTDSPTTDQGGDEEPECRQKTFLCVVMTYLGGCPSVLPRYKHTDGKIC